VQFIYFFFAIVFLGVSAQGFTVSKDIGKDKEDALLQQTDSLIIQIKNLQDSLKNPASHPKMVNDTIYLEK